MDGVKDALLDLRATGQRSVTGFVRDHLDELESLMRSGIRQAAILERLSAIGFPMKAGTFRSALKQVREERAGGVKSPVSFPSDSGGVVAPVPEAVSGSRSEGGGRALDKVFQGRSRVVDLDQYS